MTTYTSQAASADSAIYSDVPTTNYGSAAGISFGEWNGGAEIGRVLVKFDLSSIPSSAFVISATLSLWIATDYADNTRTHRVYRQKRAWTQAGVTWNKYDGTNDWQTAGGFGANDCEQTDIGSVSIAHDTAVATEVQWSLTAASVQAMLDGSFTNNGFMVKADTENNDMWAVHSVESETTGSRPKLVIVYSLGTNAIWWF